MNFLRRLFHRHRWVLHSHDITDYQFVCYEWGREISRCARWRAVATVQCWCGDRQLRQSPGFGKGFFTKEAALCWVRAQCHDTVPDGVPPNLDTAPTRKP